LYFLKIFFHFLFFPSHAQSFHSHLHVIMKNENHPMRTRAMRDHRA